jgi:hypothetical protein
LAGSIAAVLAFEKLRLAKCKQMLYVRKPRLSILKLPVRLPSK